MGKQKMNWEVVLTSHYDSVDNTRRASLKDSYQFVLDDLELAAEYLKIDENSVSKDDLYKHYVY